MTQSCVARTLFSDGVIRFIPRSTRFSYWTEVVDEHYDDPVDFRRLVRRDFCIQNGQNLCIEYVLTRVLTGLSFDTVIFLEGQPSPLRWHVSHWDSNQSLVESDRVRHEAQDRLSCMSLRS